VKPARTLALLAAALLASACLQFRYQRFSRFEPVDELAAADLVPGTELADCLTTFGAPLWVWETLDERGCGAALAWGWYDSTDRGAQLSTPVSDRFSASFDWDDLDARMRGLVLFFDPEWKLTTRRLGLLRDLTADLRRRRPLRVQDL